MSNDPAGTLGGKWVELLKKIAPRTVRVALLFNPATAVSLQYTLPSIQAAASSFAIQVSEAPVHAKDEIEGVIAAQTRDPGGGLIVMPDVFNDVNRELIIAQAARYSVPAIYFNRFFSGGLISYGDVRIEQFRLAAGYIDRLLKGEKPSCRLPFTACLHRGEVCMASMKKEEARRAVLSEYDRWGVVCGRSRTSNADRLSPLWVLLSMPYCDDVYSDQAKRQPTASITFE
jgi:hypothetical protein